MAVNRFKIMRRIMYNGRLSRVGDFAYVTMRSSHGNNYTAAVYRISETLCVFLSNDSYYDGSGRLRVSAYLQRDFSYGYSIGAENADCVLSIASRCGTSIAVDTSNKPIDVICEIVQNESSDNSVESPLPESLYSDKYERRNTYSGYHGYHAHHGTYLNRPLGSIPKYMFGIELEVEFLSNRDRENFCDMQSNWFFCERDGSLGDNGCEIITIPLLPSDAKDVDFWKRLTDNLTKARSWDTGRCGLHVHISRSILGDNEEKRSESLGKLLYLYHHQLKDTRLNLKVYGRSTGYHERDGKTDFGNAANLLGKDVLRIKDVQEKIKHSLIDRSLDERYFDINLLNSNTIEFRKGRGSINPDRIAAIVEYNERMCTYARNTPWQQIDYADFVSYLKATAKGVALIDLIETWS